jgi:hypothetical protein
MASVVHRAYPASLVLLGKKKSFFHCVWSSVADPDPLVRGTDPDPDLSSKNSKENLDSYCFVTSLWLFILENDVNVPSKSDKQKNLEIKISFFNFLLASWRSLTKIAGSGAGAGTKSRPVSQRYGSADPYPHQNVTDPQHWFEAFLYFESSSSKVFFCGSVSFLLRDPTFLLGQIFGSDSLLDFSLQNWSNRQWYTPTLMLF